MASLGTEAQGEVPQVEQAWTGLPSSLTRTVNVGVTSSWWREVAGRGPGADLGSHQQGPPKGAPT